MIQGTTCIFSKKAGGVVGRREEGGSPLAQVEYLYNLVHQTLLHLASKRTLSQKTSIDANGKDLDVGARAPRPAVARWPTHAAGHVARVRRGDVPAAGRH